MRDRPQDAEDRFSRLYREGYGPICAYTARRCPDPDLASQVVAETFTVAWRRLDEALAGGRPWLFRTARLSLANALRSERRQGRTAARVATLDRPPTSVGGDQDVLEGRHVREVLASLSARDQEVLTLTYWEDLATADLGTALGCTTGTAAVRLHRARARFRRALAAADGPAPQPTTHEETSR